MILDESIKTPVGEIEVWFGSCRSEWFIIFPSWLKTDDGSKVEESRGQHPTRKVESVGGRFPKARSNKYHGRVIF